MLRKTASPTKTAPKKATTAKSAAKPSASKSGAGRTGRQAGIAKRPAAAIDRSSMDLAAAIDTLHSQMNAAMARIAELATIQANHNKVVIRTAPLDRATATFQRIVAEVVDDQLSEMLPPLVALRNELAGRAGAGTGAAGDGESARRGCETLDHVLKIAGVQSYDPRPGEAVDPVIHLAVGETSRGDLPAGVVAETVQSGFRTARGKVIVPAKVRVNRR